ncbi:Glucan endo-1,3-beta-D-glucosidase [Platanthera zijinensis]|uniref:Glucan endo-1,3-beta-D-glucosidase n=1 Tax=Platanthera zijinensis TaxID=2320716 RepID=A0AAP0BY74_9ASPA
MKQNLSTVRVFACESTDPIKTWCVAKPSTKEEDLQNNIQFACSKIDCGLIQGGGPCFDPQTSISLASVVMNLYYQSAPIKTWCVAKPSTKEEDLQNNIQFACSKIDCGLIQGGGPCFDPQTSISLASVVMNLYYQSAVMEAGPAPSPHGKNLRRENRRRQEAEPAPTAGTPSAALAMASRGHDRPPSPRPAGGKSPPGGARPAP